jgi:hypothetical protein
MKRSPLLVAVALAALGAALPVASAYGGRTSGLRFSAGSMSWISAQAGWMLGSAPCGRVTCTTVIGTTDGGRTWNRLGSLDAPLTTEQATGVTEIRFADTQHGWAFGPALWATADGGATWQPQQLDAARPVLALTGDHAGVYAVESACQFEQAVADCTHRTTLWRTMPGQTSWSQVSLRLPAANQALLAGYGPVTYLVIPTVDPTNPDVLEASVDGQGWNARPDPCSKGDGEYLSGITASSDTDVALLCQADIGFGQAEKRVFRSTDTASTTTPAGTLPFYGIVSQLAAAPDGTLLVSSFSIGSWIYRNAGAQTWTTSEDLGDGGIGWNGMTAPTNATGYVIHGPAFCCGGYGPGELWRSDDGGATWRQVQVTPGP